MKHMVWNDEMAEGAKKWASNCEWKHDRNSGYGENLFAYASSAPIGNDEQLLNTLISGIQRWYDEQSDFNYHSNSCAPGKVCGHYTQMIWADSFELGCGYSTACTDIFSGATPYQTMLVSTCYRENDRLSCFSDLSVTFTNFVVSFTHIGM